MAAALNGSPASKAKLEPGDIILDFIRKAVTDAAQFRSLMVQA